jgi:hypothetical protein
MIGSLAGIARGDPTYFRFILGAVSRFCVVFSEKPLARNRGTRRASKVDYAVDNASSGLLVDRTPESLARTILRWVDGGGRCLSFGQGAGERSHLNSPEKSRVDLLLELHRTRVWDA